MLDLSIFYNSIYDYKDECDSDKHNMGGPEHDPQNVEGGFGLNQEVMPSYVQMCLCGLSNVMRKGYRYLKDNGIEIIC